MYFKWPKNSIRGLKNVISGQFPVKLSLKKNSENFYCTKRFVFEFHGKSLELFLSYRAYFRRYQHLRGFWQSTARQCKLVP